MRGAHMYKVYRNPENLFSSLFEVWKPIPDYEGLYEISSHGRVKAKEKYKLDRWGNHRLCKEQLMKLKTTKSGYLSVGLCKNSKKKHPMVHRLVAKSFIKNCENKPTVNHKDTDKTNNFVINLEWSTSSEQMKHAVDNNLLEVRGRAKYSKKFKENVLTYYKENSVSIKALSVHFSISERTAGRIVNGGVKPRQTTRVLKDRIIKQDVIAKEAVEEIKRLREEGYTLSKLSSLFDRSISQIHRICKNESRTTEIE